ncbi:MAG: ATP phosphoribosyltransferase regulatory subunit [Cytobacillus gottheilii]|uniref:ATP phosphoribosyltransferase regulatory subunit n=1 Tax=Cytobacillus gottheilii TaxID=859144 RepID=UPI00083052B2|nr:ATP phosphoribosyltransferase regulatory subunit [Cytobacillus gottheilii]
MSPLYMFEKPLGMRDTLPELYEIKRNVRASVENEMRSWGYQFIATPALEYDETVGAASAIMEQQLFKLLDQQGRTLVLRPDMTAPIARVAASKLLKRNIPIRLAYSENVYRAQQREGGRPAEFEQIGVECIGDSTISADGEGIALMISALKAAGLQEFQLSVGHIGFVRKLFQQIVGTDERVEALTRFLYEKNYVGFKMHVENLSLSSIDKQRLLRFLHLKGQDETIPAAFDILENGQGAEEVEELRQLWDIIADYGYEDIVKFDLTQVSHMSYYTGIVYEAYAEKVGFPIGNGGRYDGLLGKFGKNTGATGFAIRFDRLLEALEETKAAEPLYAIFFSAERRKEAFQLAGEQRASGKKVVLQDISGVHDLDANTKQYEDIVYLLGKSGKESMQ